MNKDFIPYVLALELKNLGFDEECYGHSYTENEENFHLDMLPLMKNSKWESVGAISIPMYHQALSWLRDKHKIYVEVTSVVNFGDECYEDEFEVIVHKKIFYNDIIIEGDFKSYEEALEIGIKESLKHIK